MVCPSVIYFGIVLVVLLVVWWSYSSPTKENYGPIKNFVQIPIQTCYHNCRQWYEKCMYDSIQDSRIPDSIGCHARYESCIRMCDYSDFFPMV